VVPVPGPSAWSAALSAAGLPSDRVSFFGFLPRKSGKRARFLEGLTDREETLVFFESVHRIQKSLSAMAEIFGDREATVCRELTKKFEEIKTGSLHDLAEWAATSVMKGEFVILIRGKE